jgi:hypothetical protein
MHLRSRLNGAESLPAEPGGFLLITHLGMQTGLFAGKLFAPKGLLRLAGSTSSRSRTRRGNHRSPEPAEEESSQSEPATQSDHPLFLLSCLPHDK